MIAAVGTAAVNCKIVNLQHEDVGARMFSCCHGSDGSKVNSIPAPN